ncbi:MAG: purine and other phosphorylase-like protein, family 1 [Pseudomonadota bacterium]
MAGRIGILTGLAMEADLVLRVSKKMNWGAATPDVRCVGMGGAGAGAAVQDLAGRGVERLVSFGLAGGLDPALAAGTLLVPHAILDGADTSFAVDEAWRSTFLDRLGADWRVAGGPLLAGAGLLTTQAAKHAAWRESGAHAADMESTEIAKVAEASGLPVLVLRAVADDAGTTLPPAASAMDRSGRLSTARLIGSLARHPWQLTALLKLGAKTRSALGALEDALPKLVEI